MPNTKLFILLEEELLKKRYQNVMIPNAKKTPNKKPNN